MNSYKFSRGGQNKNCLHSKTKKYTNSLIVYTTFYQCYEKCFSLIGRQVCVHSLYQDLGLCIWGCMFSMFMWSFHFWNIYLYNWNLNWLGLDIDAAYFIHSVLFVLSHLLFKPAPKATPVSLSEAFIIISALIIISLHFSPLEVGVRAQRQLLYDTSPLEQRGLPTGAAWTCWGLNPDLQITTTILGRIRLF